MKLCEFYDWRKRLRIHKTHFRLSPVPSCLFFPCDTMHFPYYTIYNSLSDVVLCLCIRCVLSGGSSSRREGEMSKLNYHSEQLKTSSCCGVSCLFPENVRLPSKLMKNGVRSYVCQIIGALGRSFGVCFPPSNPPTLDSRNNSRNFRSEFVSTEFSA